MTSKRPNEFVTPWNYVKAREEMIPKIFSCIPLEPFAEPGFITYFGNREKSFERPIDDLTGYDRLHDRHPYDHTKPRCDRAKPDKIWLGIHEENKRRSVAIVTDHNYGRPNRLQIDRPTKKFCRFNVLQWELHRDNETNFFAINRSLQ